MLISRIDGVVAPSMRVILFRVRDARIRVVRSDSAALRSDQRAGLPMVEQAMENLARAGVGKRIDVVVGDAGYVTEDNLGLEDELGVELLIATRNRKRAGPGDDPRPRGRIPKGLSKTQRMDRKLRTKRGSVSTEDGAHRSSRCLGSSDSGVRDGSGGAA